VSRASHCGQLHPVLLIFGQASKSKDLLHVLFGPPVPLVVFHLMFQAEVPSCRVEVRSDDIEGDPSLCKVVQRREPPRQDIRSVCEHSGCSTLIESIDINYLPHIQTKHGSIVQIGNIP
jgi:hypothetical protein